MNVENTSKESVTDIKVENESDDEVESEINLYADHVIKEEMVIGPVMLQVVDVTYCPEDVPVLKKPKLETTDEETDQVKTEKGINEDNTERIISNVDTNKNSSIDKTLRNNEQTNCDVLRKCNQPPGLAVNLFVCNECGRKFRKKYILAEHIIWHEKKLSCSHCDYKCNSERDLLTHLGRAKKPDYKCSYCEFTFKYQSDLTAHLRVHTGEKPYSCSYCDYKCNQKGTMSVHLRTHTGEKPYSCPHCDFKFSRKNNLSRHLRTHSREKPK